MYDFYPEWGPARHRADADAHTDVATAVRRPRYWQPETAAERVAAMAGVSRGGRPEGWDGRFDRPDDN